MEQANLSERFSDDDHWSLTFRSHVLGLEDFLAANIKPRWRDRIPGEHTVYLAGMIARELDRGYLAQIQEYLVEDPGQIDRVEFEGDTIKGSRSSGERFVTYSPETDNTALIGELMSLHAV